MCPAKAHVTHNIFEHNIEKKRLKVILMKNIFFLKYIVVTFKNIFKLGFNKHNFSQNKYFQFTQERKNIG